jgi:hypothetical protein
MYLICYLVILLVYFFETSILSFLVTSSLQSITEDFGFSPFIALFLRVSLKLLSDCFAISWFVGLP